MHTEERRIYRFLVDFLDFVRLRVDLAPANPAIHIIKCPASVTKGSLKGQPDTARVHQVPVPARREVQPSSRQCKVVVRKLVKGVARHARHWRVPISRHLFDDA
jgi:hypothetical protein